MKYRLTAKHCEISEAQKKYIQDHVESTGKILSHLSEQIEMEIILKGMDHEPWFVGSMHLPLPKKSLHVDVSGVTIDEALSVGFARLRREIQTYRGTHFPGDSAYPKKDTIRTGE